MTIKVLLVDDDESMCQLLAENLKTHGLEPTWTKSAAEAIETLRHNAFDVVVTDLNMDELNGLELCERVAGMQPDLPVVVITGYGSLETAVGAIRAGAYDFINKPFQIEELIMAIERATKNRVLRDEVRRLQRIVDGETRGGNMIGDSAVMRRLYDIIQRVAATDMTVLVTGESGTGKELVARSLHQRSARKNGPFVAINCAAVPPNLLESELFGHVKGAFTDARAMRDGLFVQATNGSLFLDEISEMPAEMQAKLLRALQERRVRPIGGNTEVEFDARLIAATNQPLEKAVEAGTFRKDLFYRINVVKIEVPTLSSRGRDVILMAETFIGEAADRAGKRVKTLSALAAEKLMAYSWPGNVRELRNCIERAVALTRNEEIQVEDLPEVVRKYQSETLSVLSDQSAQLLPMHEVEQRYVTKILKAANGNKTAAARILGFDRRTLYRKLERYGLSGKPPATGT
jgi:DNA-binding NtrC family response regulator